MRLPVSRKFYLIYRVK